MKMRPKMTAAATITPITTLGRPLFGLEGVLAALFALPSTVWVTKVVERGVDELGSGVGSASVGGGVRTVGVERVDVVVLVERVLLVVLVLRVLVERDLVDVDVSSSPMPKIPERIMEIMSPSSSA
jgi:hypothetical protein